MCYTSMLVIQYCLKPQALLTSSLICAPSAPFTLRTLVSLGSNKQQPNKLHFQNVSQKLYCKTHVSPGSSSPPQFHTVEQNDRLMIHEADRRRAIKNNY